MTKIDIFSGFLGAGKTTLIKKLIKEAYAGEQVVLIENEFGEIGIDGGFLKDSGINITEMNSGCICCSLVGDFRTALAQVIDTYHPDRIIIEPSGVGKLSDVIRAASTADPNAAVLNCFTTVADAGKVKMYMKNFGEFFNDQIEHASAIVLSHTDLASDKKIAEAVALIREHNPESVIVTTPWDKLTGMEILSAMEKKDTLDDILKELAEESEHEHHHHHHHDDDEECHCGCHHDDDDDDDDDEDEHEHHHHHEDGEECHCGHHHHHHADEVFTSWGVETTHKFTKEQITAVLNAFIEDPSLGMILRAKGIVEGENGEWIHFDYVPGEPDVRNGSAGIIGRLCVIGSGIDKARIAELFGI